MLWACWRRENAASHIEGFSMRDNGYGILLMVGLFCGLAAGIVMGQPSAGTVIGLGIGGLAALGLRFLARY